MQKTKKIGPSSTDSKSKFKEILVNLVVFLSTFIILFFLLELFFVLFNSVPYYGVQEGLLTTNNNYNYGFTPNWSGTHNSVDFFSNVSINNLGLNDIPNLTYKSDKKTILFLGDSVTEGYGVNKEFAFPSIFEKNVETSFRVINSGVRGYGTKQEYLYYINEGYKFSPDHVILTFVNNDLMNNFENNFIYKGFPVKELTLKKKLQVNLFLLFKKSNFFRFLYYDLYYNQKSTDFIFVNNHSMSLSSNKEALDLFENYVVNLSAELEKSNTTFVVVLQPWLKAYQVYGDYNYSQGDLIVNNEIKKILDYNNISYFDLTDDLMFAQENNTLYFEFLDGHFNIEGNKILGELIAERFLEWEKINR